MNILLLQIVTNEVLKQKMLSCAQKADKLDLAYR